MKHDTLEILLHICSEVNLHEERCRDTIDMFSNGNPDSIVRNRKCHLQGHKYPSLWVCKKKKKAKQKQKKQHDAASVLVSILSDEEEEQPQVNALEDVPLKSISDGEWISDDQ